MAPCSGARVLRTLATLSLRGLRAHAARLLLTLFTVVLGTGFVAGTLLLTTTLDHSVTSSAEAGYDGVDIVVVPGDGQRSLPDAASDHLAGSPLVDRLNIRGDHSVALSRDGQALDTGDRTIRPTPWYDQDGLVGPPRTLTEGTAPGPDAVAVSSRTAEELNLSPGSTLTLNDQAGELPLTVSGIFGTGPDADTDADTGAATEEHQLDLVLGRDTYLQRYAGAGLPGLVATVAPGQQAPEVAAALTDELAALPGTPEPPTVRTGEQAAATDSAALTAGLGFVGYILLAFAVIALAVGMFIIANTFAMTVAQRTRDFSLLRALGLSRRQVTVTVTAEALVIGLVGSVLGVGAGVAMVVGILAIAARLDLGLPTLELAPTTGTILLPVVLGVLVTLAAAWTPARRAGAPSPLAGVRDAVEPPVPRTRTVSGTLVLLAGVAMAVIAALTDGWGTEARASVSGLGTLAVVVGVILVGPAVCARVLPALGRLVGTPFGSAGRMASGIGRRQPRRTSGTAFALTLGLSLVTLTGMLGSSVTASVAGVVDSEVTADLVVGPPGGAVDVAVPGSVAGRITETPGVGATYTVGKAPARVGDSTTLITVGSGDPQHTFALGETSGELNPGHDGLVVSRSFADEHDLDLGATVPVGVLTQTQTVDMPVAGIFEQSRLLGDVIIDSNAYWRLAPGSQGSGGHRILAVAVTGDGTAEPAALRESLEAATQEYPMLQVQTPAEFGGEQAVIIDRLVVVVYALLALAVAVAVLGVVNTLALSVVERRREFGVLRAVGMGRGQVAGMVLIEAVQTAVLGAFAGIGIGLLAGWSLLGSLSAEGVDTVVVPWSTVVLVVIGAVAAGAVAALTPALRAARMPVLQAVAENDDQP